MRTVLAAYAALALSACGQTTPATTGEAPAATVPLTAAEATAQDICGASQYGAMVGSNFAAATFPSDANIRIIQPGQPVTQDFVPERLNLITDANGIITSLECY
ncbi:MAG: hypothetical protein KF779_06670 [Hyphomonadaceae bacterium]|nr:hypothetical protein [Hyphomonadaceae bacterium]